VKFLSVCSGIEAASVALGPLGWTAAGFAEIDRAASRALAHHYPGTPNYDDFTAIDPAAVGVVDYLIGGTPCQAFSVAGKRASLADARGNLALAYTVLAHDLVRHAGLRGCLWENVPGVLSAPDNAFGCYLGALVGAGRALIPPRGRGWPHAGMVCGPRARAAWRVLDAQYFGLAQRRERVFVVADFGSGADPAQVLFERAGLHGNPAPRREAAPGTAGTITASAGRQRGAGTDPGLRQAFGGRLEPLEAATTPNAHGGRHGRLAFDSETFIVSPTPPSNAIIPVAFDARQRDVCVYGDRAGAVDTDGYSQALAFHENQRGEVTINDTAAALKVGGGKPGQGYPAVLAFSSQDHGQDAASGLAPTLRAMTGAHANGGGQIAVAYDLRGRADGAQFEGPHDTANIRAASGGSSRSYVAEIAPTLLAGRNANGGDRPPGTQVDTAESLIASPWAVRRLTPLECERLQGFPDGYTAIPGAADGARYKQLGNSFAVNVVRWIGRRIMEATNG
jgi:DNA (cytosine-5)-methyltransferase 1